MWEDCLPIIISVMAILESGWMPVLCNTRYGEAIVYISEMATWPPHSIMQNVSAIWDWRWGLPISLIPGKSASNCLLKAEYFISNFPTINGNWCIRLKVPWGVVLLPIQCRFVLRLMHPITPGHGWLWAVCVS